MDPTEQNQIFELMHAIDRARRAWRNANLKSGINKSQFFTMLMLRNKGVFPNTEHPQVSHDPFGTMTLSELAKAMNQTMPALSQRITKLEEMGYVKRTSDVSDRRTVWICLTEEGNAVLEENRKNMFLHMAGIINFMENEKSHSVNQLIDSCNLLADAVSKEFNL